MRGTQLVACACLVAASAALPLPTADQLRWFEDEITGQGTFNMGTYDACGIGAVTLEGSSRHAQAEYVSLPPGAAFNPVSLDVESWVKGLAAANMTHSLLTLSHGCGYVLFPVNTTLPPTGAAYNYTIRQSPYANGTADIARLYVDACRKYGVRPGFYFGIMNNAFLNVIGGVAQQQRSYAGQVIVTQAEYTAIFLANLRQAWTDYGELAEIWFDGGFPEGTGPQISALLQELQPGAVVFQGPGGNAVRWCGTESGMLTAPVWCNAASSGTSGSGSIDGTGFFPAEADTCFQTGSAGEEVAAPYAGCWFYNPDMVPKSLKQLVASYHATVGINAVLNLGWTPNQDGVLPAAHAQRYQEFGDFVRGCYVGNVTLEVISSPVALPSMSFSVSANKTATVDRVVLQEDLTRGQRVTNFSLSVDGAAVVSAQSMGHKHIALLAAPMQLTPASNITLTVHQSLDIPYIRSLVFHMCERP
ncbi:Alpha-L-fucosidase 1 [Diplonema papillatum]|nr:Alpha-L-fucosidase 1 [Diplonema papillatum]